MYKTFLCFFFFFKDLFLFIYDRHRERKREAETQAEGEAGSMSGAAGLDPGTPGSRPWPKAGAKPLSHPGIPQIKSFFKKVNVGTPGWLSG